MIEILAQAPNQPIPKIIDGYQLQLPVLITILGGMIAIVSSIVKLTSFIKDLDKDLKLTSMDAMGQRNLILEKIMSNKMENGLKFDSVEARLNDMNSRLRRLENLPSEDKG